MKQTIRLTEGELKGLIKKVLSESWVDSLVHHNKLAQKDVTRKAKQQDPNFDLNQAFDNKINNKDGWRASSMKDETFSNGMTSIFQFVSSIKNNYDFWDSLFTNNRINSNIKEEIRNSITVIMKYLGDNNSPILEAMSNQFYESGNQIHAVNFDGRNYNSAVGNSTNTGQVNTGVAYNPLTRKMETMNMQQAYNLVKKLIAQAKEEGYDDLCNGDAIGVPIDWASKADPFEVLDKCKANDDYHEPEDWYERNEHGDFDDLNESIYRAIRKVLH